MKRRDALKVLGFGAVASGAVKGSAFFHAELLDHVAWPSRFTSGHSADVFVDGRQVYYCVEASETEGWAMYWWRECSPFEEPKGQQFRFDHQRHLIRKTISGNVEIRFHNPDSRDVLLKQQNERKQKVKQC